MGAVVGGWGALIVLFSVASTLAITVRQREAEIGLLRAIGATPRQARRLVRAEALLVTLLGRRCRCASLASLGGRALLGHAAQRRTWSPTTSRTAAARRSAATARARRADQPGRRRDHRPPRDPRPGHPRARRGRRRRRPDAAGGGSRRRAAVGYGIAMAVVTITVTAHDDDPYAAMSTSGSSSILVGVGLAAVAPCCCAGLACWPGRLVGAGVAGHLAAYNTCAPRAPARRRARARSSCSPRRRSAR